MTMPRNINLHLLEQLKALVTERHVTRAAQAAQIGQPAMSATLARLRAMLKDPLLVKTARGMEPTPYALELAKAIQVAFEVLDAPERMRTDFDIATTERTIRVISTEAVALLFLPSLMARVRREAPQLTIRWTSGDMRRAAELLREGEVELVISSLRTIPSDYYSSPLYAQRACCIAAADHPAIRGSLTMELFLQFPHVVFNLSQTSYSVVDSLVDSALDGLGCQRTVALTVPSFLVSPAVVATSDLLAVIPDRIATSSAEREQLQILELPFDIGALDLAMYWHARGHTDPALQWLRAALRDTTEGMH
ncbi:MAG: LysR family transcriptional regulator [Gammaproteobacteria bacterium]|nr:LysR family transcriptional regulator [Gammaproteobacteria bacterium]MBU1444140.1 LysR family transcriptional regulator [Gammaproteobacteria bacterium]MBU2287595.1 LysR family transcriptional regulator [Gammaproteobacteria bacterium]